MITPKLTKIFIEGTLLLADNDKLNSLCKCNYRIRR